MDKDTLEKFSLNPEQSLFKGSDTELKERYSFASADELKSIVANTQRESKLVNQLITNSNLSSWSKGICSDTQKAVEAAKESNNAKAANDEDFEMVEVEDNSEDVQME